MPRRPARARFTEEQIQARRARLPTPTYPGGLPVSERKDDILAAIRDHQVVIVAGETGSGKSTQIPKICLELGRGVQGLIGHTQPRRIAARSVAERIADELGSELGDAVGYAVRFTDKVTERTFVKVMTDGILLAEIQRDRQLRQYDTLIVDEAHERSLNIDFILGYLRQLLPRRPDLKVIVTSATIDTERFSRHFGDAPVVEVSGRTYPVEVRYEPVVDEEDDIGRDQTQAVADAVSELRGEGPGDILVFLSGEREIRDTADALHRMDLPDTEILPLYARLSTAEQHRVFAPHRGRRIVLSTNVAETSLTVPGIRYVVDTGFARISRYNRRTKVQRLPIEAISQASANQRAGRCGRVAPGICIRLYSEEDFASRPEFTEPEILRTNLASVILQMGAIGLGDIPAFPFVEPPDARSIKDGIDLLEELGAFDSSARDAAGRPHITPLGRRLAQLPLDPRFGRMVLAADRNGCLQEVMVITAALSIQDPRERPTGKEQAAAEQHARFADPDSDFISYLRLWEYVKEQQRALSSSQFRRLCRAEYLHYLRIREWQDIYTQLRQVIRQLGLHLNSSPAEPDAIHRSLLAGMLSHIGAFSAERREYHGARDARFAIAPGSVLFKKSPRWVMAAELVETNRMWARVVARIQPEWAEALAAHLVKRTYSEPHWDSRRGAARAYERVTLYGVPIVARRTIDYGRIEPEVAREMLIRHALVEGDWELRHRFFVENTALIDGVRALEDRARRRDLLVDEDVLFAFYDSQIPPHVTSTRRFDSWWKNARRQRPDLLSFTPELLINPAAGRVRFSDYPDVWRQGDLELPLFYVFDPLADDDGVTVEIPLAVLNSVHEAGFDWHIPGLRAELVAALIRSLPKAVRRAFVPAPDYAAAFLERASPADGPLLACLTDVLTRMTGDPIPLGSWDLEQLPGHLRITFRVVDAAGRTIAVGKDVELLKRRQRERIREGIAEAGRAYEQTSLRTWTIGTLPRVVQVTWQGHQVTAYPALVDEGETVAVRMLPSPAEQSRAMWSGTRRLLLLAVPSPAKALSRSMTNETKLALARVGEATAGALLDDCVTAAVDSIMAAHGGPAWDEDGFSDLVAAVKADLNRTALQVTKTVGRILVVAASIGARLSAMTAPSLAPSVGDARSHLARLVHRGFVTDASARRLSDVLRYLQALERRLDKLPDAPGRDADLAGRVQELEQQYQWLLRVLPPDQAVTAEVDEVHWMLEELRVSLFAQTVGTAFPVSEKRVLRKLEALGAG